LVFPTIDIAAVSTEKNKRLKRIIKMGKIDRQNLEGDSTIHRRTTFFKINQFGNSIGRELGSCLFHGNASLIVYIGLHVSDTLI
jgi:hypothetical protein